MAKVIATPITRKARAVDPNSKRQICQKVFGENLHILKSDKPNEFRATVLNTLRANPKFKTTTESSLGAIYNDAKHVFISAGKCEPFGRFGLGRNGTSTKPKPAKMIDGAKWAVEDKATGIRVAYAIKRNEAISARSCKDTQKLVQLS